MDSLKQPCSPQFELYCNAGHLDDSHKPKKPTAVPIPSNIALSTSVGDLDANDRRASLQLQKQIYGHRVSASCSSRLHASPSPVQEIFPRAETPPIPIPSTESHKSASTSPTTLPASPSPPITTASHSPHSPLTPLLLSTLPPKPSTPAPLTPTSVVTTSISPPNPSNTPNSSLSETDMPPPPPPRHRHHHHSRHSPSSPPPSNSPQIPPKTRHRISQSTSKTVLVGMRSASALMLPESQVIEMATRMVEGLFSALPVRAAMFQSGRFSVVWGASDSSTRMIEFSHPFTVKPHVCAWLVGSTGIYRVSSEQLTVTQMGFSLKVPINSTAVNWVAYLTPPSSPVLSTAIKLVLVSPPALTDVLLSKVQECVQLFSVNGCGSDGQTLLHAAAYAGNMELVNWLLKKDGIYIDSQDERGWTPLMSCLNTGHFTIAQRLLSFGANPTICNFCKQTVLHFIARISSVDKICEEVTRSILKQSGIVNNTNDTGETALMAACYTGASLHYISLLLEFGADPNLGNLRGETPLLKATLADNIPLVELLLRNRGDPHKGVEGDTPYDHASTPQLLELFQRVEQSHKAAPPTLPGWDGPTTDDVSNAVRDSVHIKRTNPHFATTTPVEDFAVLIEKSECKDLRTRIDVFVKSFSKSKYTLEYESRRMRRFLNDVEVAMKQHKIWGALQPDHFEISCELMRRAIFGRLYNQLFNKKDLQAKDSALSKHIETLSPLAVPQNMHLRGDVDFDLVAAAEKELLEMDHFVTPEEKMICIVNSCKILVSTLKGMGSSAGADDFLPLFIFTVIRANPPHLHSNLSFIERFREEDDMQLESNCIFTHLFCAAQYIETTITTESLKQAGAESAAESKESSSRAPPDSRTRTATDLSKSPPRATSSISTATSSASSETTTSITSTSTSTSISTSTTSHSTTTTSPNNSQGTSTTDIRGSATTTTTSFS
ncbi:Vacuolar protein sorting-associated protein 9a [Pelomyxa schiedti]|nr:Vacuolar protein sorting-associated protein 9a [Pelomyxa schiedti]